MNPPPRPRGELQMRCFIDPADWTKDVVELSLDESHHASRVLRAREGSVLHVFNGCGDTGSATVVLAGGRRVGVRITERQSHAQPALRVSLVQSVVREQKMDWIIQKATELGVAAIYPVTTAHTVVQLDAGRASSRAARWARVALEAAKQSGNPWLPRIEPAGRLDEYLARGDSDETLLVGALAPDARPLIEVLRGLPRTPPVRVSVLIGPEGDFTADELAGMVARGAIPVGFGSTVLRAETAAVFALSALRYEFA